MNTLAELKKRFSPRSRWGAINIAPRREFGSLTWLDAADRRQPQDGALTNLDCMMDEPELSPIPPAKVAPVSAGIEAGLRKHATAV